VVVQDDLDQLLDILPSELGLMLLTHPRRSQLVEVRALAWWRQLLQGAGACRHGSRHSHALFTPTPETSAPAPPAPHPQVVLDLGRRPEARFQGHPGEFLSEALVTREQLEAAAAAVGPFGGDNRAGIQGTLHRISALRSRAGAVVGLTCRVGRAISGNASMVQDLLEGECGCVRLCSRLELVCLEAPSSRRARASLRQHRR
jgi:stage III sporulation protein SpoIIIAA